MDQCSIVMLIIGSKLTNPESILIGLDFMLISFDLNKSVYTSWRIALVEFNTNFSHTA